MTSVVPRAAYSDAELSRLYPSNLELQQVQVLLRHGERTPVKPRFENAGLPPYWPYCSAMRHMRSVVVNPQKSSLSTFEWKRQFETFAADDSSTTAKSAAGDADSLCDFGMLTDLGRQSTFELGSRLRRLYVDQLGFLPATMDSNDFIYLRATPIPRALESLQQAFHGLYPIQKRAHQLPPPIIVSRLFSEETLLPNDTYCARFAELAKAFAQRTADTWNPTDEIAYINKKIGKYMPEKSPVVAVDSKPRLVGIFDSICATDVHGPQTKLPKEFYDPKIFKTSERIVSEEYFAGYRESNEYRKLGIGSLLGDVVQRMVSSAENVDSPFKIGLSGCHDVTLAATVASLGAYNDFIWPPYTSHVALELFRRTDQSKPDPSSTTSSKSSWFPSIISAGSSHIGRKQTSQLSDAEKQKMDGYYVRVRYNDEPILIPGCKTVGNHLEGDESFCTLVCPTVPYNRSFPCITRTN